MLGSIAGDIIGSVYERHPVKRKDFPLFSPNCTFTDDSVLTVAVANAVLSGGNYPASIKEIGRKYPDCGYGSSFYRWLMSDSVAPYNSWGNGSAMRVSPVGFAYSTEDQVLSESKRSAEVTHNHVEGIKGAQAASLAIFIARKYKDKTRIKDELQHIFGYDLGRSLDRIRPGYQFDISCQGSVPEAVISFLESTSYEDAVRNAVSLGGDSDTLACIAGGIAHAYYGSLPGNIVGKIKEILPGYLWEIAERFCRRYSIAIT